MGNVWGGGGRRGAREGCGRMDVKRGGTHVLSSGKDSIKDSGCQVWSARLAAGFGKVKNALFTSGAGCWDVKTSRKDSS